MKKTAILANAVLASTLLLNASITWGANAWIGGINVTKIVTTDGSHGGCMAALSIDPKSKLSSCGSEFVTFSCTGVNTTVNNANNMFDTAKMAYALNKPVALGITDEKGHDGYCQVYRFHLLP